MESRKGMVNIQPSTDNATIRVRPEHGNSEGGLATSRALVAEAIFIGQGNQILDGEDGFF